MGESAESECRGVEWSLGDDWEEGSEPRVGMLLRCESYLLLASVSSIKQT